jgi:ABC-type glycerol-3-phosphate transport system substrate-binding protein
MKLSPFQTIIFVVFGFAGLIGLFVFATYSGESSKETTGPVTIWGTLPREGMQTMFLTLAQADVTFKDVSYIEKSEVTLTADLATAIATGSGPDLVLASQEVLQPLSRFVALIPSAQLPEATFVNSFVQAGSVYAAQDGTGYYGVPFLVDPIVLYSNRTILSSNGVARPPATWEALVGLVPSVAITTPSRQIVRGLIALGTYDNVANARGILSTLFLQTGVPVSGYAPGGNLVVNLGGRGAAGVPAGHSVLSFYTQFADPAKVSYTWNASLRNSEQMFLTGDLVLYLGYASRASFLRAANPNLNFIVTAVPQPATATSRSVYGLVYAFMVSRGAQNPSGAYTIAALLTSATEQAAAALATGLAPASLNQLSESPADPVAAVAYAEALYAKGWISPSPTDTDRVFSSMISNVTSGRSTLDTALISAEQALTALLQQ